MLFKGFLALVNYDLDALHAQIKLFCQRLVANAVEYSSAAYRPVSLGKDPLFNQVCDIASRCTMTIHTHSPFSIQLVPGSLIDIFF